MRNFVLLKTTNNSKTTVMERTDNSSENIGVRSGLLTLAGLVLYFFIMRMINISHSPVAWGLNFVILFAGIFFSFRFLRAHSKPNVNYFPGLILGGITTVLSVIPYAFFVYFYFAMIEPAMIPVLDNNIFFMGGGGPVTPGKAAAATFVEGICSGGIISFTLMQYYKAGWRISQHEHRIHG